MRQTGQSVLSAMSAEVRSGRYARCAKREWMVMAMGKKLTNGKISIGAYMFPDRKKPCLCIEEGNEIVVYGHFNTIDGADKFMDKLGRLVGAEMEGAEDAK